MLHISLFSGIGGFDLASTWAGWENIVSCEINPFAQRILKYYWPETYHHNDINTLTYKKIDEELSKRKGPNWRTDKIVLSGGFPCQPFSNNGKRKGTEDPRHLWPEMLRTIKEIQPDWIVGENVYGLVDWNGSMVFNQVQTDLENQGYEVQPYLLPACGKNAPHKRYRIFIVAYTNNDKHKTKQGEISKKNGIQKFTGKKMEPGKFNGTSFPGNVSDTESRRQRGLRNEGETSGTPKSNQPFGGLFGIPGWDKFPTEPSICSGNDGISTKLDGITFSKWREESLKGYGNAVVPQLALSIFNCINKYEKLLNENKI